MARTITPIKFKAKLCAPAEGGDWTFFRLPKDASDQLPARAQVSVEGTMNGFAFWTTLQPDSYGGHWMKVEPGLSDGAKAKAGDTVELDIAPMPVEPEPEVPDDLRQALDASPAAMATWLDTTPLARRDWVTWMIQAKKAETRTKHIVKMIDMLSKGKRRICCFDRAGVVTKAFVCPTAAEDE